MIMPRFRLPVYAHYELDHVSPKLKRHIINIHSPVKTEAQRTHCNELSVEGKPVSALRGICRAPQPALGGGGLGIAV